MHKHKNFILSQEAIVGCEASSGQLSKRSSIVRERCGYSPPDPMLGAQEAGEAAKRWVEQAQKASEEVTAVTRFENAIAMYYLADFVHNDEPNDTPTTINARCVNVGIVHGHI